MWHPKLLDLLDNAYTMQEIIEFGRASEVWIYIEIGRLKDGLKLGTYFLKSVVRQAVDIRMHKREFLTLISGWEGLWDRKAR